MVDAMCTGSYRNDDGGSAAIANDSAHCEGVMMAMVTVVVMLLLQFPLPFRFTKNNED